MFSLPVRRSRIRAASLCGRLEFCFLPFCLRVILPVLDQRQGVIPMEWTTPQHEEIDLNCEISSYANAEI